MTRLTLPRRHTAALTTTALYLTTAALYPRIAVLCLASWLLPILSGCSADAASEPEPRFDTPGAFVAREEAPGSYDLHHTLFTLNPENQGSWLFSIQYGHALPSLEASYDLARRLPRDRADGVLSAIEQSEFLSRPVAVVWFRTLTEAETDVLR